VQNNRVYVDGHLVDAVLLTDQQWAQLVAANRESTKRRLVKCAWCWQEDHVTHWMQTFSMPNGTRVVRHQPGESDEHPYAALESSEHKALCSRVERVGLAEGFEAQREAVAADGKTRSDVLLKGNVQVSYEMQHSPFKSGYGASERTRRALAAGRDHVAWHTDNEAVGRSAQVAMLRSNRATLPQIENPRYELRMIGGYRVPLVWTCTVREGYRCPNGRYSGCGATHFDTDPAALTLDDFARKAPAGLIVPVMPLDRRGYWTTAQGYELWQEHCGQAEQRSSDLTAEARRSRHTAEGHSRPRPRIEVRKLSVLDWRDRSHVATYPGPCRVCGKAAYLLDEQGRHAHKVCVEESDA
jgi:hypothetical protein